MVQTSQRTIGGQENNIWIKFYVVWTLFNWIIIIIIIIQWYTYSVPHKLLIIIINSLQYVYDLCGNTVSLYYVHI